MKVQPEGKKFSSRTSWRAKLEKQQEPKLVDVPPLMQARFGNGKMLIPKPLDVDALVRAVPRGRLVTVGQIRERLAAEYHADVTCPLTTGIFLRIAAEAAEEDRRAGKGRITPYWRVVQNHGVLYQKFPGGVKAQAVSLEREGHTIEARGKGGAHVRDFERSLVDW